MNACKDVILPIMTGLVVGFIVCGVVMFMLINMTK